ILATLNPDYAQIETDKEIINVSDLPTEYPEKRPFFTESTDFYNNGAFYSRNITDIKFGLKIRKLGELLKFDVTSVFDGNDQLWFAGHSIFGDSEFYGELVGALKHQPGRIDYNITTHLLKWAFHKRLGLSSWIGTINKPNTGKNEWETVNSIRWITRNFTLGYWSHYKTELYNPNTLGLNYLSNEFHHFLWSKYSIINPSGTLRNSSLQLAFDYYDLTSHSGNSYYTLTLTNDYELHFNDYLGNWTLSLIYILPTIQKFRYRNIVDYNQDEIFKDAFSQFVLIEDRASTYSLKLSSDQSKSIGFTLDVTNNHIRQALSNNINFELYWKINPDLLIKYSLGYIFINGSEYQEKFEQIIHRLQFEYNLNDKLNIRAIVQPNIARLPNAYDYENNLSSFNLTVSWEYLPGSFIYLVYNRYRNSEQSNELSKSILDNNQSLILKINKSFSL
ncbi:MAG: DUF5916 domain-containing protein, partial [Ignavibacteria bacterium]